MAIVTEKNFIFFEKLHLDNLPYTGYIFYVVKHV